MAWVFLVIAGVFEITWAVGLKLSEGFTKLWPSVLTIAAMILSYVFLAQAVKSLPLGTAYAIWTGIGAVGVAVAGIVLFHEPASVLRLVSISLVVAGIIGLRLATPPSRFPGPPRPRSPVTLRRLIRAWPLQPENQRSGCPNQPNRERENRAFPPS